jgi:hypothetical protein
MEDEEEKANKYYYNIETEIQESIPSPLLAPALIAHPSSLERECQTQGKIPKARLGWTRARR